MFHNNNDKIGKCKRKIKRTSEISSEWIKPNVNEVENNFISKKLIPSIYSFPSSFLLQPGAWLMWLWCNLNSRLQADKIHNIMNVVYVQWSEAAGNE